MLLFFNRSRSLLAISLMEASRPVVLEMVCMLTGISIHVESGAKATKSRLLAEVRTSTT